MSRGQTAVTEAEGGRERASGKVAVKLWLAWRVTGSLGFSFSKIYDPKIRIMLKSMGFPWTESTETCEKRRLLTRRGREGRRCAHKLIPTASSGRQ